MRVYLSSTLNDLGLERQAVKEALGGECTVVESYIADERSVSESCLSDVADCDLYIGIVGLRYGFIPPGQAHSITELEYESARERNVPTLVFIKDGDEIKSKFCDAVTNEHPRELIESFRQRFTSGGEGAPRGSFFKTPEDLKSHVLKAYLRLSRRLAAPLRASPGKSTVTAIEGPPYRGLLPFLQEHADRFFGRDAEIEALVDRLVAKGQRFIALIGASGSGKSSLVYAGLIPKLTGSSGLGGVHWHAVTFKPRELGDDPFQPLAAALNNEFRDQAWRVPNLMRRLRTHPPDIVAVARETIGDGALSEQILLFVDQFEEVFAGAVDSSARAAFLELLLAAAACPLLRVVIALRSDFYDRWPQDEAFITLLNAGHFPVAVPGPAAMEKMIVGPAQAKGLIFSPPSLVQRILDDTGTGPGALALAQFALAKLYDKRSDNALTQTTYEEIGGVAGAIDGLAEQAVKNAGEPLDEEALSRLFLSIASVEEKGQELAIVRRRSAKSDLPEASINLAEQLVNERLLVSTGGTSDQPAVFEVGHEAVFTHWKRFKKWYEVYGEDLAVRRHTERAAADWEKSHRSRAMGWVWERQRPALEALRALNQLSPPPPDTEFTDSGVATWRILEPRLSESKPPLRSFLRPEPLALLDELNSDVTPHQRREEIGLRLNQLGFWRRGAGLNSAGLPDIGWIDIPAGEVKLNTQERFRVEQFRLARYPVTWAQYRAFLDGEDGYCEEMWWEGLPREGKASTKAASFGNYPAINISWYDALAYCRWLSVKLKLDIRLPTEWEWQWAAVGDTNQEYPWPGKWNAARANSDEAGIGHTVAVGLYPLGRSPFGADDMAGNVWEWCLNEFDDPTRISPTASVAPVRRGGCWDIDPGSCSATFRDTLRSAMSDRYHLGFRLCCGSPIPQNFVIREHRRPAPDVASTSPAAEYETRLKYDYDVFISFAPIENERLAHEELGWITRFHGSLEALLSARMGRKVRMLRADTGQGNDAFPDQAFEQYGRTAVFVSVLTPHYLNSDRCMAEVREFCDQAKQSGGLFVDGKPRVFKVLKMPVNTQESLPPALKDLLGYEFFTMEHGVPLTLDLTFETQDYNRKCGKLAWEIAQLLKTTQAGPGDKGSATHVKAKAAIYLAQCASDRAETREILEVELRRSGYIVLPDRQLPHDETGYRETVKALLERCALSVHLVGATYGSVPDGFSEKSAVVLQLELAVQQSQRARLRRVIWLPAGTEPLDPLQEAFIRTLYENAEAASAADLIAGDIEALKTTIYTTLQKLDMTEPDPSGEQSAAIDRERLIYFICTEKDRKAALPLRKYLRQQGYNLCLPVFDGNAGVVREGHRHSMATCDAVVLFYGAGDEAWKQTIDREMKRMPAYRSGITSPSIFTYVAPPMTGEKENLIMEGAPNLIRGLEDSPDGEMGALVRALKLG